MLKSCAVLLCASLIACNSGTTPPSPKISVADSRAAATPAPAAQNTAPATASNTTVPQKLADIAGSGATDCGRTSQLAGADVQKASDCAMTAAKARKPFHVEYDMPGLAVGVAGNASGKIFAVQSEADNGKAAEAKVTDCPAELRVAQSGRVTCMPPGNMGVAPGSGNPHASGGMTMPPAGAPNPHAAAPTKSH